MARRSNCTLDTSGRTLLAWGIEACVISFHARWRYVAMAHQPLERAVAAQGFSFYDQSRA
ncbi:MAG: hypothetical protein LBO67_08930 [Spirochaetaceae bacterium]|nr:hypothetical protein [Spirochaetaceae bacterium]